MQTGRLNHHLAILARPYTIHQLSQYARALTSIIPFESARTSIMTLFTPILEGKETQWLRPTSVEIMFIKAHGLLFTGKSPAAYRACVDQLVLQGQFESFIKEQGTKFREGIAAYAAFSCVASLFQFGELSPKIGSKSALRRAYDADLKRRRASAAAASTGAAEGPTSPVLDTLGEEDAQSSKNSVELAAPLAMGTLRVGLQQRNDPNVGPMLHVYLVFIWSLCTTPGAMDAMEGLIPWLEIIEYQNSLTSAKAVNLDVRSAEFPVAKDQPNRPLWEDFVLDGQIFAKFYYPKGFISNAAVDDEEKDRELPSMAETRSLRNRWLGYRLAADGRYMTYDEDAGQFLATQLAKDLHNENPFPVLEPMAATKAADVATSLDWPKPPLAKAMEYRPREQYHKPATPSSIPSKGPQILKRQSKADVEKMDTDRAKSENVAKVSSADKYKPAYARGKTRGTMDAAAAEPTGPRPDDAVVIIDPEQPPGEYTHDDA